MGGQIPESLGDFWPVCPREFSKAAALRVANWMLDEYGVKVALKRAARHRLNHPPGSWGRKHWDVAIKWLEAKT